MVTSVRVGRTVRLNTLRSMPRYAGASRRRTKRGGIMMLICTRWQPDKGTRVVIRMSRPTKSPRLNALTTANRYRVRVLIPLHDIDVKLHSVLDASVGRTCYQ